MPALRFPRSMSIRWRILAWFVVPVLILMANVAVVNYFAYRSVTKDLVLERDKDLIRLSGIQLAASFRDYEDRLTSVARDSGVLTGQRPLGPGILVSEAGPLAVFDGGAVLITRDGTVVDQYPFGSNLVGTAWASPGLMAELLRTNRPVYSPVLDVPGSEAGVVSITVPIIGVGGALEGAVAGMFRIGEPAVSAFYGGIVRLRLAQSGIVYVTDRTGRVIYHSNPHQVGQVLASHLPVQRALAGETDAIRTTGFTGDEVAAAFAPIPGTSWLLVSEESWADVSEGANSFQRWVILILVLDVLAAAAVAAIGLRRFMRPIFELNRAAVAVGEGEYGRQVPVRSDDEIGRLAAAFNQMSADLRTSYENLEQRIREREQELRASEMRYTDMVENAAAGIVTVRDSKFIHVNRAACEILGADREQIIGCSVENWLTDEDLDTWRGLRERLVGPGQRVEDFKIGLTRPDGSRAIVYVTARRNAQEEGGNVDAFIRDVTSRLQTEEELFEQARELAVSDERNRMAREIHDTIAQGLTGVVLQLEAAEDAFNGTESETKVHVERAKSLARESLAEARRSVWNLSPGALEQKTLDEALDEEVTKFAARGMEGASFSLTGKPVELSSETQVALLRICQEALINARKYARASSIEVKLRFEPDEVVLEIADDGTGFDPDAVPISDTGGFGLSSMRRRAQVEGGTLEVISSIGSGTKVIARIPI